jgi:C4-dicarboxylate transporter, DctM subunit
MSDFWITSMLVISLFALLGSGVWIGLTLAGVAWIGMELFSSRPAGDAMALTIWGASSSWTLTALPLFRLDGRDPVPHQAVGKHVPRSGSLGQCTAGPPAAHQHPGLHHLRGGVGLVGGHLRHRGQDEHARAGPARLPDDKIVGSLGGASTLGLLIPPSIIMIVYGVAAEVSIAKLFMAGVLPGIMLAALFSGYLMVWALLNPSKVPRAEAAATFGRKVYESRHLLPVWADRRGYRLHLQRCATATEAAAIGVVGALILSAVQGSLSVRTFLDSLIGATRLYCMIALILAGAAFLTLSMGYIGLPRHLAEWVTSLNLSPVVLIIALALFYMMLGCFLDGISMIVLTMGVILPTVAAAGIDLIWFGIFVVIVVEMAQITPPVGFNLFVLQGMTRREITWIARVCAPYFFLMALALSLLYAFPQIALWLPSRM